MVRLLHSDTLLFESFEGDDIPPYAILSHTWLSTKEELTYQQMKDPSDGDKSLPGYLKVAKCGSIAAERGLRYFWADTVSIDKTSSAELTEAINSMFYWYKKADVCFVYLSDVAHSDDQSAVHAEFRDSRWFTRGWTLQELIAPVEVQFFSKEWLPLGSKLDHLDLIRDITQIHKRALDEKPEPLGNFSIAQRMSWAANRQTTRLEDTAYCLMGIFDVNMVLLYGERGKAFIRLQEEIMKRSNDQSIFCWLDAEANPLTQHGLLARHPKYFADSASISSNAFFNTNKEFILTNKGLKIELLIFSVPAIGHTERIAALECRIDGQPSHKPAVSLLPLQAYQKGKTGNVQYTRIFTDRLDTVKDADHSKNGWRCQQLYILHDVSDMLRQMAERTSLVRFYIPEIADNTSPAGTVKVEQIDPLHCWEAQTRLLEMDRTLGRMGSITFTHHHSEMTYKVVVSFGLEEEVLRDKRNVKPWVRIENTSDFRPPQRSDSTLQFRQWNWQGAHGPIYAYHSRLSVSTIASTTAALRRRSPDVVWEARIQSTRLLTGTIQAIYISLRDAPDPVSDLIGQGDWIHASARLFSISDVAFDSQ